LVYRLAAGWTVRASNAPGGTRCSLIRQCFASQHQGVGLGCRSWCTALLRAGRSGPQTPLGTRDILFSTPVQTGLQAHPVSCTIDTVSFPGVRRPGRDVDHPPASSANITHMWSCTSTRPSVPPFGCYGVIFTFLMP
jgi:hypothetical protein